MNFQPDLFHVGTATPNDHLHPYRWVNASEGNTCPVVHSRFKREGATEVDAYAKLMHLHQPSGRIELINEITGWLLPKACGLPVAQSAFVAAIRAGDLPPDLLATLHNTTAQDVLYFFCTEEVSQSQARGIVPTETLIEEQAKWLHSHATLALDEWLANADRHVGNLVRRGKDDFVLIDHGRLLARSPVPPWWSQGELAALQDARFDNLLHHHTYVYRNINHPKAVAAGFEDCTQKAQLQADAMRRALFEIAYWCSKIAPGHSSDWLAFLVSRVQNARQLLADRFRILI